MVDYNLDKGVNMEYDKVLELKRLRLKVFNKVWRNTFKMVLNKKELVQICATKSYILVTIG